jgi:hypothetical protein
MTTQQTRGTKTTGQVKSSPAARQLATPTSRLFNVLNHRFVAPAVGPNAKRQGSNMPLEAGR